MVGLEDVSEDGGMILEHINANREVRNIILDENNTISEFIGNCMVYIEGLSEDPERIIKPISAILDGYNAIRKVFEGY